MFIRLLLLLTLVPICEIYLILGAHRWFAERFGSGNALLITIGSILLTGIIGANLARQQGLSVFARLQQATGRGEMPTGAIIDGVMVLIGGALLLTPGYLTDAFGFSLLIPFTRGIYRQLFLRAIQEQIRRGSMRVHFSHSHAQQAHRHTQTGPQGRAPGSNHRDVIDVEAEDVDK